MKKLLLIGVLLGVSLQANCNPYILGLDKKPSKIVFKNTLVWTEEKNRWNVSSLQDKVDLNSFKCKEQSYILVNNNSKSYSTPPYEDSSYYIKRGWNYLEGHINGIDIEETFKDVKGVEFVYTYEPVTKAWAGYSPLKYLRDKMYNTRILKLKKVEPKRGIYVYATKSLSVKIKNVMINEACKKFLNNSSFEAIVDSGMKNAFTYGKDHSISIKSRYNTHHIRGVYDDTRVMLIYPDLGVEKRASLKYGPAVPATMMRYAKEYEDKIFYMFDYKDKKCYEGIFPSMKSPPFGVLKELK